MSKRPEVTGKKVCRWARNGEVASHLNITKMTLWRWQRNPELKFPQPSEVNGIDWTDLNQVDDWMRRRVVNRAAEQVA